MKSGLFAASVAALTLGSAAASHAQGVYVLPSRSFYSEETRDYVTIRRKDMVSANTLVQAELARLGYYHGPIDGNVDPGSKTSRAIALYQRDHRLPVTGAIDGNVIASLSGLR